VCVDNICYIHVCVGGAGGVCLPVWCVVCEAASVLARVWCVCPGVC
jgi:hypothetical protein